MSITTGTKLGQYEVQDFIGQGAMGLVFRAYHSQLERTGAVKVLQAIAPDRNTTARFRHEAQAIAQLRHQNIVNVYDFGEYQGTPYMIVEYVPGGSLADRLNSGQVDPAQALKYLRGIAAGLDYAHGIGIVHRDVKPANVLLEKDNTPVLADFGLAKLVQGSSLKSMSGVTTGTPAYMAPEQVTGDAVGPAADRYSLATIAYEMFAGVIPFDGSGLMEILYAQVHREPPAPSTRNTSLSSHVDDVILRGLAKDPALRWESCLAFVDALEAALAKKAKPAAARTLLAPPVAASTVALNRAVAAVAVAQPTLVDAVYSGATVAIPYPAPAPPAAKKQSRRRVIAVGVAATLVVLLIVGAIGYIATHPSPTLSLSASTVTAGDTVVVTTSHVPANQNGTIQLHSTTHDFPFQADANGSSSTDILIPLDVGSGDHTVKICWASACHASATLHVVNPAALGSPSPGATPSTTPGASPQPTPAPGQSPVPSAVPTDRPGPIPTPRATPTPRPLPTPIPAASITLVSVSATGNTTLLFHYFYAGTANIFVCQNSALAGQPATCYAAPGNPRSVAPGASITVTFKTPAGIKPTAPVVAGQAYVVANSLKSNLVNVGP